MHALVQASQRGKSGQHDRQPLRDAHLLRARHLFQVRAQVAGEDLVHANRRRQPVREVHVEARAFEQSSRVRGEAWPRARVTLVRRVEDDVVRRSAEAPGTRAELTHRSDERRAFSDRARDRPLPAPRPEVRRDAREVLALHRPRLVRQPQADEAAERSGRADRAAEVSAPVERRHARAHRRRAAARASARGAREVERVSHRPHDVIVALRGEREVTEVRLAEKDGSRSRQYVIAARRLRRYSRLVAERAARGADARRVPHILQHVRDASERAVRGRVDDTRGLREDGEHRRELRVALPDHARARLDRVLAKSLLADRDQILIARWRRRNGFCGAHAHEDFFFALFAPAFFLPGIGKLTVAASFFIRLSTSRWSVCTAASRAS